MDFYLKGENFVGKCGRREKKNKEKNSNYELYCPRGECCLEQKTTLKNVIYSYINMMMYIGGVKGVCYREKLLCL